MSDVVDDARLARESLGFDEWSVTPDPDQLVPDSIAREHRSADFRSRVADGPPAIVLTRGDVDGLTTAALVVEHYGRATVVESFGQGGAYRLEHALADLDEHAVANTDVYIAGLAPTTDVEAALAGLTERDCVVRWYDDRQLDADVRDDLQRAGIELRVDETACTTSLLATEFGVERGSQRGDLVGVTEDRCLGNGEGERGDWLAAYADLAEAEEYVETVLEHGADLPADVRERVDAAMEQNVKLEAAAVGRAQYTVVGGHPIAWTYTAGGRSDEISNTLVEHPDYEFHIAVVMRSRGDIRFHSHSSGEEFVGCHEIAARLGGDGHPTAARCSAPVETFRELAGYWASAGQSVWPRVRDAIETVLEGTETGESDTGT